MTEHEDLCALDALEQSRRLAAGEISAAELMQATLSRIEAVNGTVNAIVSLAEPELLLAEARAADAAPRRGWLHGIPVAIKDLADAAGFPTSMGSPLFAGQIAERDDIMVARLRAAGAIVIGKTNTPEFGMGSNTFNPVHGITRNPYASDRTAGGSSGGAAAALAARMISVADGSDMMGSLRNPAAWNNVYGMRPSWGTVPSEPEGDLFLHQLATAGPMARSPGDLAALLDTMTGADPRQPHGASPPDTLPDLDRPTGALRLGWLGDWGGALPFDPGLLEFSAAGVAALAALGHEVTELAAPFPAEAIWESWTCLRSWAFAGGLGALYDDPARRPALKTAAQWEIARGQGFGAMQVHRASVIRSDWFRAATGLFQAQDVLVLPTTQVWPFDAGIEHPVEIAGQGMDSYHRWMEVVVPAGLLGLPVVNIPIGFSEQGLPAGLQLIGPRGSDALLLRLAQQWHKATDWPGRRPPVL